MKKEDQAFIPFIGMCGLLVMCMSTYAVLIVRTGSSGFIVRMAERGSKYVRAENGCFHMVARVLKDRVFTLTVDNGKAFSHHADVSSEPVFCQAISLVETGSERATNGLVRQHFRRVTECAVP